MNRPRSLLIPSMLIAVALVVSAHLLGDAAVKTRRARDGVTVKGLSMKRVVSDVASWEATLSVTGNSLESGFALASQQATQAVEFLRSLGAS